jgi:hypothetical protein
MCVPLVHGAIWGGFAVSHLAHTRLAHRLPIV